MAYIGLNILLSSPWIQSQIIDLIESTARKELKTQVTIGGFSTPFLNRVNLQDITIYDQQRDTLLFASKLSGSIKLISLFENKIDIKNLQLFGLNVRLRQDSISSPTNMQFILDALQKQPQQKNHLTFALGNFILRRAGFSVDVKSEKETPFLFNPHHIKASNITAKLSAKSLSKDSLDIHINRLALEEKSGFKLQRFSAHLTASDSLMKIAQFNIQFPLSDLKLDTIELRYKGMSAFSHFEDSVRMKIRINFRQIGLQDFAAFVPGFRHATDIFSFKGEIDGTVNQLDLTNLSLQYGNEISLLGNISLTNISHPEKGSIRGELNHLNIQTASISQITEQFSARPLSLPKEISRLGLLHFSGQVAGSFHDLKAKGLLKSDIGSLSLDFACQKDKQENLLFHGLVSSSTLLLSKLTGSPVVDHLAFQIKTQGKLSNKGKLYAKGSLDIGSISLNGYPLEQISLQGSIEPDYYQMDISLNDPNAYFTLNGFFDKRGDLPVIAVSGLIERLHLEKLGLTKIYDYSTLSLQIDSHFKGDHVDNINGYIAINNINFSTNKGDIIIPSLSVTAEKNENESHLGVYSDILSGELIGKYSFVHIFEDLTNIGGLYLPVLFEKPTQFFSEIDNAFDFHLDIQNVSQISTVLQLPFELDQPASLSGQFDERARLIKITADIPSLKIGKNKFKDSFLYCDNSKGDLQLKVKTKMNNSADNFFHLSVDTHTQNDSIASSVHFSTSGSKTYSGSLKTGIKLKKIQNWIEVVSGKTQKKAISKELQEQISSSRMVADIEISPTSVYLNDTLWYIKASSIEIDSSKIKVNRFAFESDFHGLHIDGTASKNSYDTLFVKLNKLNLDYLFTIIPLNDISFGGEASGDIVLTSLMSSPKAEADLFVKKVFFNHSLLGDLSVKGKWIPEKNMMSLDGQLYNEFNDLTPIKGGLFFAKDSLDIEFGINNVNVAFLRRWLDGILTDMNGRASGYFKLFGKFEFLKLHGDLSLQDGSFKVDFLNTRYHLSDSIFLRPDKIYFKEAAVRDDLGNQATVSGEITHLFFLDWKYNIAINAHNLMALNTKAKDSDLFYGKVFASGFVNIRGANNVTTITANVLTNAHSDFSFILGGQSSAPEVSFIKYVDPNKTVEKKERIAKDSLDKVRIMREQVKDMSSRMIVNLNLEITPDLNMTLVMNPHADDRITAVGNGNLRVNFDTNNDVKMFGSYTIRSGQYTFTMQEVIRKDFVINDGSSVTFASNPMEAQLNIGAKYSLTASLSDLLDQSSLNNVKRTSVPVNCLLNITGSLQKPVLGFGIDLPTSDEDLKRKVQNVVNSEDQISRQIVYLLMIGKFYTPDYMRGVVSTSGTSDITSFASTTLSSQLNNIIGKIDNSWNINTNIRSNDNFTDYELGLALSKQLLNNRLIINGSVVYKQNQTTTTNFLGDIDVEYKLTRDGKFRLKAYNHTNDNSYYYRSLMTQGLGVVYTEDFGSFKELFTIKKKKPVADSTDITITIPEKPQPTDKESSE